MCCQKKMRSNFHDDCNRATRKATWDRSFGPLTRTAPAVVASSEPGFSRNAWASTRVAFVCDRCIAA